MASVSILTRPNIAYKSKRYIDETVVVRILLFYFPHLSRIHHFNCISRVRVLSKSNFTILFIQAKHIVRGFDFISSV